jgi:hypothetical protein
MSKRATIGLVKGALQLMAVELGDLHAQSSEVLLILLVIQHQVEECSCFAGLLAAALWSIECWRLDLIHSNRKPFL